MFDFKGRFGRIDFLIALLLAAAGVALGLALSQSSPAWDAFVWAMSAWAAASVATKRLHDMNRSGWCLLALAVPPANIALVLFCLLFPGDEGENAYGAPKPVGVDLSPEAA